MNKAISLKVKFWWRAALLLLLTLNIPAQSIGQVLQTITYTVTVNDVSMIRINPYSIINMSLLASAAGEAMAEKTSSSSYLQLTSVVPLNQTRRVMAVISSGTVPTGTMLKLTVGSGSGVGNFGVPSSTITLQRGINQNIINNIGSGYTGGSTGNGFNLTYTWQIDQSTYQYLRAVLSVPIILTYTITSN